MIKNVTTRDCRKSSDKIVKGFTGLLYAVKND